MAIVKDITGNRYGRLVALSLAADRASDGQARWVCRCDCGQEATVNSNNLRRGASRSCGCLRSELARTRSRTHGHTIGGPTPEYTAWAGMIQRCENRKHTATRDYAGRGITVCKRWHKFENFLADMGPKPAGCTSIDRIDNNRGYKPGNCRWTVAIVQANNKRNTMIVAYQGAAMPLRMAWRMAGEKAPIGIVQARINRGWDVTEAVETGMLPRAGQRNLGSRYYGGR